ncbi:hypothetical protein V2K64_20900 [Pseudomonas alliivorans]|nr:hypothetical protein [Pseudomonas alliivorans]
MQDMDARQIEFQLPEVIVDLWKARQALAAHYVSSGLKFTLDGRLVGDIAEALALEHFDLLIPQKRTGGVDALTRAGKTVQVKATGNARSGPAFTPGKGFADYLLFFRIDFESNTAMVAYNGPEAPVRSLLPENGWNGTKVLSLATIQRLALEVNPRDQLPLKAHASLPNTDMTR